MPTTVNLRLALWALLGMALFLNYQMWSHDYIEMVAPAPSGANATPALPLDSTVPSATLPTGTPPAASVATPAVSASAGADSAHALVADTPLAPSVHVMTDVLDAEVSLAGGELKRVDLLAYPQDKNAPNVPVRLLNNDSASSMFVVESGLAGAQGESTPTHLALYHADVSELKLMPGQNEIQ